MVELRPVCEQCEPALQLAMRTDKSIIYGQPDGFRPLELDLYRPGPALAGPYPVIVQIHGGGWRVSSRHTGPRETRGWERDIFTRLVDAGFAVASIEYRYSGEARYPTPVDDVCDAVRWLGEHAADYDLDTGRVAVWGQSAGGHLAAMVGLATDVGPIRATCCWYPVADLRIADHESATVPEALLLGQPVGADLELAFQASPVSRVRADAPPFLLIHGTNDTWAPHSHSVALRDALAGVGAAIELQSIEGADHFFMGHDDIEGIFARTVEFFRQHTG
jgi:acetyl esterase/lipase